MGGIPLLRAIVVLVAQRLPDELVGSGIVNFVAQDRPQRIVGQRWHRHKQGEKEQGEEEQGEEVAGRGRKVL